MFNKNKQTKIPEMWSRIKCLNKTKGNLVEKQQNQNTRLTLQ